MIRKEQQESDDEDYDKNFWMREGGLVEGGGEGGRG